LGPVSFAVCTQQLFLRSCMPFFRHQATCLAHNNEAGPRRDPPRFQQLRPSQLLKSHRRQPWNPIEEFSPLPRSLIKKPRRTLLPYPILTQGGFTTLPDNSTTPRPYFLSRNVHEVTLDTVPITTSWSRTDFYPVVYFSLRPAEENHETPYYLASTRSPFAPPTFDPRRLPQRKRKQSELKEEGRIIRQRQWRSYRPIL
jgi:hypothetical protein